MPRAGQSVIHDGRTLTVVGPTVDPEVWIARDAQGNVYLDAAVIDGAGIPQADPDPAPAAVATVAPAAAPAEAPAERRRARNSNSNDDQDDERELHCPACGVVYQGSLSQHNCERLKGVKCLKCSAVCLDRLREPTSYGFLCQGCENSGIYVCKACGAPKSRDDGEPKWGMCPSCDPDVPNSVWESRQEALGNDIVVESRTNRPFGVELETFMDPTKRQAPLPREFNWPHKPDVSIQPDPGCSDPREWYSPPLRGDGGLAILRTQVERLRKAGYRSNKSCGLHVHVSMVSAQDDDIEALHKFGTWVQRDIFKLVAPSRASSKYCKVLGEMSVDKVNKYRWMSIESMNRHGTVEYRLHHGITRPEQVVNWVRLCLLMTERGMKMGRMSERPQGDLFDLLGCTKYERLYWTTAARRHDESATFPRR